MAKTLFLLVSKEYYYGYRVHAVSESPISYIGGLETVGNRNPRVIEIKDDWVAYQETYGECKVTSGCGWVFVDGKYADHTPVPLSKVLGKGITAT